MPVKRIVIENGRAAGVETDNGEVFSSWLVVSNADPKSTIMDLVSPRNVETGFTRRVHHIRSLGNAAKLHLALDGLPDFDGLDDPNGRMIIAPDMDAIEFNFDDAKYGDCPSEPVMEIVVPSLHDSKLAPDGKHVLSAHVMYVPYRRKDGWTDDARNAMKERVIDTIAKYTSGIRDQIVASEFLTPADLEREYRVTGGHWHHTEFAMDQMLMMRPTYGAAQYSTPLQGLFLCGAGSHPAGDLVGAAGHNAAQEILR